MIALFAVAAVAVISTVRFAVTSAQTLSGSSIIFGSGTLTDSEESSSVSSSSSSSSSFSSFSSSSSLGTSSLMPVIRTNLPQADVLESSAMTVSLVGNRTGPTVRIETAASGAFILPLSSFHWSESQPDPTRRTAMGEFTVEFEQNSFSPQLFLAAASGERYGSVVIAARDPITGEERSRWILTDVIVTLYETAHSGSGILPTDTVGFGFSTIESEFIDKTQPQTGTSTVKTGWDTKRQRPL